jgi:glycosyltransferase involved in cell wall biosynthesis
VGCNPPETRHLPPFVKAVGNLRKSDPGERQKLYSILADSHFLLLPTRAECFGIVFCEASSFGVPSITTDVGGVSSAVRNGVNGQLFSLQANAQAYSEYIYQIMSNRRSYEELAASSFNEYSTRLNWTTAAGTVVDIISELL